MERHIILHVPEVIWGTSLAVVQTSGEHAMNGGQFSALPMAWRALFALLLLNGVAIGWFAAHAVSLSGASGMRLSAIGLAALALLTLYATWTRKAWAAWSAIAVASGVLTI